MAGSHAFGMICVGGGALHGCHPRGGDTGGHHTWPGSAAHPCGDPEWAGADHERRRHLAWRCRPCLQQRRQADWGGGVAARSPPLHCHRVAAQPGADLGHCLTEAHLRTVSGTGRLEAGSDPDSEEALLLPL